MHQKRRPSVLFEETTCTIWGDRAHDLGRQSARFGETERTIWGDRAHDLGRRNQPQTLTIKGLSVHRLILTYLTYTHTRSFVCAKK